MLLQCWELRLLCGFGCGGWGDAWMLVVWVGCFGFFGVLLMFYGLVVLLVGVFGVIWILVVCFVCGDCGFGFVCYDLPWWVVWFWCFCF